MQDNWLDAQAVPLPLDGTAFLAYIQHNVGKATRFDVVWAPPSPNHRYSWWVTSSRSISCPIVHTHIDVSDCYIITHWQPLLGPVCKVSFPHKACKTFNECRREQVCLDAWNCSSVAVGDKHKAFSSNTDCKG